MKEIIGTTNAWGWHAGGDDDATRDVINEDITYATMHHKKIRNLIGPTSPSIQQKSAAHFILFYLSSLFLILSFNLI